MKPITHFEVYLVKLGRWALQGRMGAADRDRATEFARSLEIDTGRPTQVIEETLDPETGHIDVRIVVKNGKPEHDVKAPAADVNIAARLFMIVVNAIGAGAIITVMVAVAISSGRDSMDFPRSTYNLMLFFSFAAAALTAGLALFKIYIPMDLILWRAKSPESQLRVTQALLHGTQTRAPARPQFTAEPPPPPPAAPAPAEAADPTKPRQETNADQGEQTSFSLAALESPPEQAAADAAAQPTAADTANDLMASLLAPHTQKLTEFADAAIGVLYASRPPLQAFERYGFNLYLAGAAMAVAEAAQLDGDLKRALIERVIIYSGTGEATAQSFCERVEASLARPRYRQLSDAGRAALAAQFEQKAEAPHAPLPGLIQQWADPSTRGSKTTRVTFLLTDLVGSTALTAKIGNSGAQRVVRAHNAVVREAIKEFKGKEIKHTGDGLLVTFPDAAAAARAAMDIQQESAAFVKENPDVPLSLRVGVHQGEASFEDGEFYGEAVLLLDGICAAADAAQISCTEEIRSRCVGGAFRFADQGMRTIKGSELQHQIFLLEWLPKPEAAKGQIEYRQIGTRPTLPAS